MPFDWIPQFISNTLFRLLVAPFRRTNSMGAGCSTNANVAPASGTTNAGTTGTNGTANTNLAGFGGRRNLAPTTETGFNNRNDATIADEPKGKLKCCQFSLALGVVHCCFCLVLTDLIIE